MWRISTLILKLKGFYKITQIVRVLWLTERSVYMRVCKHGCDVKMFCYSRAYHTSTNLKKFLSSKLDTFTLFNHSFTNKLCQFCFHLRWHLKRERSVFWKASFCKTRTDYACKTVYKTLRLVRISLLISAITKSFAFFSRKLFYKSNRKLFSCVCIAWYKHLRVWENSRQLCKPST